jgi:hypothetical protein
VMIPRETAKPQPTKLTIRIVPKVTTTTFRKQNIPRPSPIRPRF